nr:hypothetical protein [uncultured Devosia sp.]
MVSSSGNSAIQPLDCNHPDPHQGDRGPAELREAGPLAEEREGEKDGEEHLQLDHQRTQPGRHAQFDGEEQQPELADADREPVADEQRPPHCRPFDEEHRWQGSKHVAQGRQQRRRHLVDTPADGNEAQPPDHCDREGENDVADGHEVISEGGRPEICQSAYPPPRGRGRGNRQRRGG